MSRIPRPKNAAPNTILTSFDINIMGRVATIRYSGEPISVLDRDGSFKVPVAWGSIPKRRWTGRSEERALAPLGSCRMSRSQRRAVPQHVIEAEDFIDGDVSAAYTAWFEYMLDEAAKP
jgi:hypothetical protein